jgi:endonuclease/exonuclease/phosphatase (EEP) superfamily protein YafD
VLGAITAGINVLTILPIYWPMPNGSAGGTQFRIVSFNVLHKNLEHEQVLTFLHAQPADLVLLMEVSDGWANVVEGLYDLYPHRHVALRDDHRGIALLSRIPWREVQIVELGHAAVPAVVARFEIDQQPVVLVGAHPFTPDTRQSAMQRNEQLEEIAKLIRAEKNAAIVVGDLNTTSFSPCFRDLLAVTGLRDSRQGRGIQASWGPVPFLEIAIDHCLVSPEIAILQRRVGPHLGSDHRPVIVDLQLRNATGGTATKRID